MRCRIRPAFLCLLVFVLLHPVSSRADSLDDWYWRNPLTGGNNLRAAAFGSNQFVVVGDSGTILTSPDGIVWTNGSSKISETLYGITYNNSTFVAVGSNGTILTSPDGITWVSRFSGTNEQLSGITYGNNTFVAVGNNGTILTSPDGITWVSRSLGPYTQLSGVTFGNKTFVAVGHGFYPYPEIGSADHELILTSYDGVTWFGTYSGRLYSGLRAVTWGNNIFVSVGDIILTSPDGITWTDHSPLVISFFLEGVTYGNNTFVAVGGANPFMIPFPEIFTSPDGRIWTSRLSSLSSSSGIVLNGGTYGNGVLLAVGNSVRNNGGTILQSDGLCAATIESDFSINVPYITYNDNFYRTDFTYVPNTLNFDLVSAQVIVDKTFYSGCRPATLSESFLLHISVLELAGKSYWLDLQYTNQGVRFIYNNSGVNN
jgi:hypothetical protein